MSHWAERYLGRPWVAGAAGPAAYDCYGLVRAVYAEIFGIDLPIVDVDAGAPLSVRHAIDGEAAQRWDPLESPSHTGDVLLLSQARRPHHVGIWIDVDGGRVLHAVEGAGVISQSLASLRIAAWNMVGIYRWRGVA